jgi:hypothetical protein
MQQGKKRNVYKQGKYIRCKEKNKKERIVEGVILGKTRHIIDIATCIKGQLLTASINYSSQKDIFVGEEEDLIIWLLKNNLNSNALASHIKLNNWAVNIGKVLASKMSVTLSI